MVWASSGIAFRCLSFVGQDVELHRGRPRERIAQRLVKVFQFVELTPAIAAAVSAGRISAKAPFRICRQKSGCELFSTVFHPAGEHN
jgi:hypothetical protein